MSVWFTMWMTVKDQTKNLLNDYIWQYFKCPTPKPTSEPYIITLFYKLLEILKLRSTVHTVNVNDLCILGLHIKESHIYTLKCIVVISTIPIGIWFLLYTSFRILKRLVHIWCYGGDILKKYRYKEYTILNSAECSCEEMLIWILDRTVEFSVVGMDCEMISTSTNNGGHPKPAILQLATQNGFCAIFQLTHMSERDIWKLHRVLANLQILLVGVAVLDDARYLNESYGLYCHGCLDLRHMANNVGIQPKGLPDLSSYVLGKSLKKNVKAGPWETKYLSEKQLNYAALDARTSVDIFMKINNDEIHRCHSWFSRLFWDEKTYWYHTLKLWRNFVERQFIFPPFMEPVLFHDQLPVSRFSATYGPYLRYFQPESANHKRFCVVCGSDDEEKIRKKAIVPFDYLISSNNSRAPYLDLCQKCLLECTEHDRQLRENLREECAAPYPIYNGPKLKFLKELAQKILMARPLQFDFSQEEIRLCELLNMDRKKLTLDALELILSMDCWPRTAHGKHVYCIYTKDRVFYGEEMLKEYWCYNFIKKMKPRYLPNSLMRF